MDKRYDLKDRSFQFSVNIVKLCLVLIRNYELQDIGRQLIRAGTSIGANIEEADGSRTRKELANKISISRKEAKETRYWLRILLEIAVIKNESNIHRIRELLTEAEELVKILSSIIIKLGDARERNI